MCASTLRGTAREGVKASASIAKSDLPAGADGRLLRIRSFVHRISFTRRFLSQYARTPFLYPATVRVDSGRRLGFLHERGHGSGGGCGGGGGGGAAASRAPAAAAQAARRETSGSRSAFIIRRLDKAKSLKLSSRQ